MTGEFADDITGCSQPLHTVADLDTLVESASRRRIVAIGEASHGTHEFYTWRAELSRRLIREHGFGWVGVEGDWPDCWRVNRWVRGEEHPELDARAALGRFERWPTWMWSNTDVADFLDWLRDENLRRPPGDRVGFYGLDVYSLWESLYQVITWLAAHAPDALPEAMAAWRCFEPYHQDPHAYAWNTRLVPQSCEQDVVELLLKVRRSAGTEDDEAFDAQQNAAIAVEAERYYRAMVRTDRGSWNIRDIHMTDTIDKLAARFGPRSKGLVWEHNTHVGDARATTMAAQGMLNVGQLLRERHGSAEVYLVGIAGYRGAVTAGSRWGAVEQVMEVPAARAGSHEALLHDALGTDAVLDLSAVDHQSPWLTVPRGHRAIGVVYDPAREGANYVPTVLGRRYDALIWCESTSPLEPLRHEPAAPADEYETEPTGV